MKTITEQIADLISDRIALIARSVRRSLRSMRKAFFVVGTMPLHKEDEIERKHS
jgi:hypothetical protein